MLEMKLYKISVKKWDYGLKTNSGFLSEIQNPKATIEKSDKSILKFSSVKLYG